MKGPVSYGYRRPSEARIHAGTWSVAARGNATESPDALPDWDYGTDLTIERMLGVDLGGILNDTGLDRSSVLTALLTWTSSATRLKGSGPPVELVAGPNRVACSVPGQELGGQLLLECRVVVNRIGPASDVLAPQRPGSTLWVDGHRMALEGGGSRFPTLPVPFSSTGLAGGRQGAWFLSVHAEDLSAAAGGALCLYLNNEHPAVVHMLEHPDDPSARQLSSVVKFDVTRQLVSLALEHPDLDQLPEHVPGSLGEVLHLMLLRLFPERTASVLESSRRTDPGEFEAELQARTGFLT